MRRLDHSDEIIADYIHKARRRCARDPLVNALVEEIDRLRNHVVDLVMEAEAGRAQDKTDFVIREDHFVLRGRLIESNASAAAERDAAIARAEKAEAERDKAHAAISDIVSTLEMFGAAWRYRTTKGAWPFTDLDEATDDD